MAGTVLPKSRGSMGIRPTADPDPRPSASGQTLSRGTTVEYAGPVPDLIGHMAGTLWQMMADLSEADRWCYRYNRETGELYVEDAETLKRYFTRKNKDAGHTEQ